MTNPTSHGPRLGVRITQEIGKSLRRGFAFLQASVSVKGLWESHYHDRSAPDRLIKDENPFVGALGSLRLEGIALQEAMDVIERTRTYTSNAMEYPGLWRYWPHLPPDADSTSICALSLGGHPWLLAGWGEKLIIDCRDEAGRFHTWIAGERTEGFDADAVVNANVIAYLGDTASTRGAKKWLVSLLDANRESDAIHYYWDEIDLYAAMAQANRVHRSLFAHKLALIASRIQARRTDDGSYGDQLRTSLALLSLFDLEAPPNADELLASIEYLLERQSNDGGWPSSPLSSGPIWPDERNFVFRSRAFDTACSLAVLNKMVQLD